MKQVACPHCGFQNFSISAYCGRCERPLNHDRTPVPRHPPPTLLPTRPPVSTRPPTPQPRAAPRLTPFPPSTPDSQPRSPPPAPLPPAADLTPAPLPIELRLPEPELPRDALKEGGGSDSVEVPPSEPPPPPLSTLPPVEPEEEKMDEADRVEVDVPVAVASGLRLGLAWLVDAVVILSIGALIAVLEMLTFSGVWSVDASHQLDFAAYWIHANPGPALHGAIVAGLFAFAYNFIAAKRGGRTAGRLVAGTVLVRVSGRRLGWSLALFRSITGIVSLALFGAGFFWSILDSKHRTWHDLLSGTVLVRRHVALPPSRRRGT